ncbi:conserved hypothetical protein [Culex quinquefasciatus]|uniref:Uncharacterized protein n=1 Tax=Culex quinquefasciatus TaxID=7176 RepID=B0WEK4_CULQU|nr:conserved hypothetical protein [Culex quinquefasciatus]|eukprot:XP_001847138.1 conserved hypothetical protein [Culex quinquefasciatus]
MIRDPGAGGPHEVPEPQPPIKYDRIPYDLGHRPPVPAVPPPVSPMDVDSEIPLDMTVRRKDSDRQPSSNSSIASLSPVALVQTTDLPNSLSSSSSSSSNSSNSNCGADVPMNLNTRPSVITKAPPPPIKKRISSMHSNGEIVIKSAVGDNLSPVNCDVFIEEHFRRSLGNTYASIYGNNNNNNQPKSSGSDTRNSSTSSSSSICSSSSTSGIGSVASSLGSVSPVVRHNPIIPPPITVEISPLIKVKPEPALLAQQQPPPPSPQQQQLPPQPPTHIRPEINVKTEPGTMQHVRPDSEEEVDDHFAKALGNDTWKMIQEKKLNL